LAAVYPFSLALEPDIIMHKRKPETFFVRTYGCQMNELDSEIMIGTLLKRGMRRVENEEQADLLIYNTCAIRDLAERKAMGKIGILSRHKKRDTIIGLTGCMATAKQSSLLKKLPAIDFVLGPNNINQLDLVLDSVIETGQRVVKTDHLFEDNIDYMVAKRDDKLHAHVSIIRGCDKHCTYCIVPYTRGREVSRHPDSIIEECRALAAQGYKELTLVGQNVNSYGKDEPEWNCLFHDLLYQLDKIEGIERIRFMTSHPVDITRELMLAIRDLPSLCEFVHFPFQAGSNRILKKMHRMYTAEQYLEKIAMLRELVPNVTFGTDIIVGFPTETEEDFLETYRLMQQVKPLVAYVYAYSQRQGTPAMRWKDDVPEMIKQDRLQRLLQLHQQICIDTFQSLLDSEQEVLVQRINGGTHEGYVKGRTRGWHRVILPGDSSLIGTNQKVKITGYSHNTLIGQPISSQIASIQDDLRQVAYL
jgi:tRNA-2-methylthio-N6-dimethylallyladenosine synthase